MMSSLLSERGENQISASWREAPGDHRIFGGSSHIHHFEPHFHETYIIGYIKSGSALAKINSRVVNLTAGTVLLVNPLDIVTCTGSSALNYDVCYPSKDFMAEIGHALGWKDTAPRFTMPTLTGVDTREIGEMLATFRDTFDSSPQASVEPEITEYLIGHADLLTRNIEHRHYPECVARACDLIEELIEEPLSIADISQRLSKSRSHFARAFHATIGLPPSVYIRQLRLARALERIRRGDSLAEVALLYGFSDQAHFTREFKRVYGTTPGKLARDLARCRHCEMHNECESTGKLPAHCIS